MTTHMIETSAKVAEVEKIIVTLKRDGRFPREVDILKAIAEDYRAGGDGMADPAFNMLETLLRKIERTNGDPGHGALLDLARHVTKHWPVIRAALIARARKLSGDKSEPTGK